MDNPLDHFWCLKLDKVKQALSDNGFDAYVVATADAARELVLTQLLAALKPASIAWGGSTTFVASGLYAALKERSDLRVIDTFDTAVGLEEKNERRRQALLTDLFITGTNAITETGQLVNLDMIGNRVAAITFGPKHVIVMAGRNKVVADTWAARERIRTFAAPANAMRLDKKTPCAKTGCCQDCKSPERICNSWTITAKSFPSGRIKVILINADAGL